MTGVSSLTARLYNIVYTLYIIYIYTPAYGIYNNNMIYYYIYV